jgi:hypothetical protein
MIKGSYKPLFTMIYQDKRPMLKKADWKKAPSLNAIAHGLYFDPSRFHIDHRTRLGKALKNMVDTLLEKFPSPPPAMAQLLAQRCAYKLIRAASYEVFIMTGEKAPGLGADRDYLSLTGQIRKDLQALHQLAKDGGPVDRVPSLSEYLSALKEANQVEPPAPSPEPVKVKTLF